MTTDTPTTEPAQPEAAEVVAKLLAIHREIEKPNGTPLEIIARIHLLAGQAAALIREQRPSAAQIAELQAEVARLREGKPGNVKETHHVIDPAVWEEIDAMLQADKR